MAISAKTEGLRQQILEQADRDRVNANAKRLADAKVLGDVCANCRHVFGVDDYYKRGKLICRQQPPALGDGAVVFRHPVVPADWTCGQWKPPMPDLSDDQARADATGADGPAGQPPRVAPRAGL